MRSLATLFVLVLAVACTPIEQSLVPSRSASPVEVAPNPKLVEFEGRLVDALAREGQLVRELAAASIGSQAQLRLVARQMTDWATEELAWLEEHPAEACYQEAAHAYETGLGDVATAAAALTRLAAASEPPSDEEGQAAGEALSTGTESLQQASALARASRAACR